MRFRAFGMVMMAAASLWGDLAFADNAQIDQALHASLREVINHGADLFNINADHAGCYRVYEGALMAVKPLLGHHPDLVKSIDDGLAEAGKMPKVVDRAFKLREVLGNIRDRVKSSPANPTPVARQTLWDKLKGKERFPTLVENFVAEVVTDPRIDFDRTGTRKFDLGKLNASVLGYIEAKAEGSVPSVAGSFREALDAGHLQEFEFSLAVALFKERLKKVGVSKADTTGLLKALAITQPALATAPTAPTEQVVRKEEPKTVSKDALWERFGGRPQFSTLVREYVAEVVADPRIDFDRAGKLRFNRDDTITEVLNYIFMKTEGAIQARQNSFKGALDATHLQDFEFDLAVALFEDRLKRTGASAAHIDDLFTTLALARKSLPVAPNVPAEVVPKAEPKPPATLWERLRGKDRLPTVVDQFVAEVAADPLIDFARAGKMKMDMPKMRESVLAYIGKKTGADMPSTADSFKDALNAGHLQDFELSLVIATLKEKLRQSGFDEADAFALLKAAEVNHQPLTIIPVAPTERVTPQPKRPPEEKKAPKDVNKIDTSALEKYDPDLVPFAAVMAIGSRGLSQIPAHELASVRLSVLQQLKE